MNSELDRLELSEAQKQEVAALLKRYLPDTEVWAYGSRLTHTAHRHSDLDLVAFAVEEQGPALAALREAFEESSLPFRVDLFAWAEIPQRFRANIEAQHAVIQRGANQ